MAANLRVKSMWPDRFDIDVSRESIEKLEVYQGLLLKWQKAINLVSNNTLDEAWVRHFADSAQLSTYIPQDTKTLMDWGSGAGFPALVLAIMRPQLDIHVVESDERKCQFMRTVSRETSAPIRIHTKRIEALDVQDVRPDVITARALASLDKLLGFGAPFVEENPNLRMVFLKGESADQELGKVRGLCDFDVDVAQSVTSPHASILSLSRIVYK